MRTELPERDRDVPGVARSLAVSPGLTERLATTRDRVLPFLPAILIAAGVLLRAIRYAHYRSLWLDEATMALNLMSRSYSQLFKALDFDQGAPPGWLVLEKLAISAFGDSERAFRLVPFLAGVASVFVFWRVAVRFLDRRAAMLALAFFALMEPFVYYSAETRPYSFDVLAALLLLWLFDRALEVDSLGRFALFAVAGVVAPWFSFGSLFVLAGTGVAVLATAGWRRDRHLLLLAAGAVAAWLVSFAIEYAAVVRHLHHLANVVAAVNGQSSSLVKNIYILFSEPGAFPRTVDALTVLLVAVGAVVLVRSSWPRFTALLVTLLAVLGVGVTHRYPVSGRWVLYLLALAVLLFGLGCASLVRSTRMPIRVVVALAVVGLLGVVVVQSSRNAARLPSAFSGTPATPQPAKQILGSLEHEWQNGDILYVSRKSEFAFRYYLTCKDCNAQSADQFRLWPFQPIGGPSQSSAAIVPQRPNLILGSSDSDLSLVVQDFERLRGKPRVWLLFTDSGGLDLNTLEFWLDHEGRQLQAIRSGAAAAFLYDLRRPAT